MSLPLVEHFFRHEYGRLVSVLSRRVGVQHLAAVEDAAQSALMRALETWPAGGLPDNPSAWLYRVARNKLLDELRTRAGRTRLLENHADDVAPASDSPDFALAGEMRDALLRMLFVCCDERVPADSQLALALKTLCGFDVREIAERLFTTEANVYKRLARAREKLRDDALPDALEPAQYAARLGRVHEVLYLLFTEGYLSSNAELAIRRELCEEALRLATLLAEHPVGNTSATLALVALMHLHLARLDARTDPSGDLLLLEEQDRSTWDAERVQVGLAFLERSAHGDELSRFHVEAGIAAEHCLAPSFAETRWEEVASRYELLESISPSPLHRLARALAVAEARGPREGLAALRGFVPPTWLEGSWLWSAALADLHLRSGDAADGARHRAAALAGAPSDAVRTALARRLGASD